MTTTNKGYTKKGMTGAVEHHHIYY